MIGDYPEAHKNYVGTLVLMISDEAKKNISN